jgi:predicted PurR-regulated permease PerM
MMQRQLPARPEPIAGLISGKQLRDTMLLLITGISLSLCWLLARPFLAPITWALALAVVAHPLHAQLERRLKPNLAAVFAIIVVAVILLTAGTFIVQTLVQETGESIRLVSSNLNVAGFHKAADHYPLLGTLARWLQSRFDLNEELKRLGALLASRASVLVSSSVWLLTQLIIALFTLFYFFRDRGKLLEFVRRLTPLSEQETDELFRRVSQTIYVSLYGNVIVKLVQGFLGGAMFWILGLPAPVLFGAAMALFAMLPVLGTSLVWGPAAIYLAITGSWVKALVLCLWGLLVVGLIDNFLYPMLVAGELRFHTLGVFFVVFGGFIVFGVAGVVLGPVILAVTVTLLEVWRVRAGISSEG